jgi:two-component system OmpR family response regulator
VISRRAFLAYVRQDETSSTREGLTVRILLVEDDPTVRGFVAKGLKEAGHVVEQADTGKEGLFLAVSETFDCIILDRMLPGGIDGLRLLETLRAQNNATPVLLLSALANVDERVAGLKAGSDDYLTKPFSFAELVARLRALLRRGSHERPTVLAVGDLRLDPGRRRAWRAKTELDLTAKEFALLEFFIRHPGEVLSRTRLLEHVWDFAFDGTSNVIDQYVAYLRRKIDRPFGREDLETVRGAGYRLRDAEDG